MGSEREEIDGGRRLPFLCECGDVGCELCVPMTRAEYCDLEQSPPNLALAPGHELEPRSGSRKRDRR